MPRGLLQLNVLTAPARAHARRSRHRERQRKVCGASQSGMESLQRTWLAFAGMPSKLGDFRQDTGPAPLTRAHTHTLSLTQLLTYKDGAVHCCAGGCGNMTALPTRNLVLLSTVAFNCVFIKSISSVTNIQNRVQQLCCKPGQGARDNIYLCRCGRLLARQNLSSSLVVVGSPSKVGQLQQHPTMEGHGTIGLRSGPCNTV